MHCRTFKQAKRRKSQHYLSDKNAHRSDQYRPQSRKVKYLVVHAEQLEKKWIKSELDRKLRYRALNGLRKAKSDSIRCIEEKKDFFH